MIWDGVHLTGSEQTPVVLVHVHAAVPPRLLSQLPQVARAQPVQGARLVVAHADS